MPRVPHLLISASLVPKFLSSRNWLQNCFLPFPETPSLFAIFFVFESSASASKHIRNWPIINKTPSCTATITLCSDEALLLSFFKEKQGSFVLSVDHLNWWKDGTSEKASQYYLTNCWADLDFAFSFCNAIVFVLSPPESKSVQTQIQSVREGLQTPPFCQESANLRKQSRKCCEFLSQSAQFHILKFSKFQAISKKLSW